jgi:hypothetical protein
MVPTRILVHAIVAEPVYVPSSLAIALIGRSEMIRNLRYTSFSKNRNAPKIARNDPCPCGRGKKHKKYRGSIAEIEARAEAVRTPVVPSTYDGASVAGDLESEARICLNGLTIQSKTSEVNFNGHKILQPKHCR